MLGMEKMRAERERGRDASVRDKVSQFREMTTKLREGWTRLFSFICSVLSNSFYFG